MALDLNRGFRRLGRALGWSGVVLWVVLWLLFLLPYVFRSSGSLIDRASDIVAYVFLLPFGSILFFLIGWGFIRIVAWVVEGFQTGIWRGRGAGEFCAVLIVFLVVPYIVYRLEILYRQTQGVLGWWSVLVLPVALGVLALSASGIRQLILRVEARLVERLSILLGLLGLTLWVAMFLVNSTMITDLTLLEVLILGIGSAVFFIVPWSCVRLIAWVIEGFREAP